MMTILERLANAYALSGALHLQVLPLVGPVLGEVDDDRSHEDAKRVEEAVQRKKGAYGV
jgi:hypothetical protein